MTGVVVWLTLAACAAETPATIVPPDVRDERLTVQLIAAEPDIVTPTGLAVDDRGRVLVVESHTHFRPPDYAGPPADRILIFEDSDGDGRVERSGTFFEGSTHTMNIGVHPEDAVYVATRMEVFRLRDLDGDGRAEQRTRIVRLETEGNYPHNGLSGFAFDFDGNVYFGLGENLGAEFKLIGTDGSSASDLEGGQIYRCRADGSELEMVAFGFWNPFHLALDTFGRLFAVDNDPDSLPPCRLMHIVPGGNYGYRYRNGRKGVHPFTAWNGELPGTLPMVSGTGEAPSGMVAYESDHLPQDYIGDLLVTSWGDHRIERHRLQPRGASFQSTAEAIVQGDENFRPVGIAVAPDGSLYISDWVSKSYDLHGQGRLWRIANKQPEVLKRPSEPSEAIRAAHRPLREEAARQLAADRETGRPLLAKLATTDTSPRVRAAAVESLRQINALEPLADVAASDQHPGVRAAAIRALPADGRCDQFARIAQPPEVRAAALRRVGPNVPATYLWECVSELDAFVAVAARAGLARRGDVSPDIELYGRSPPERLAALLVLRESRDPKAKTALARFLKDPDGAVRFAAIQWVGEERLVEFRNALLDALSAGPATSLLFGGYLAALERLDGAQRAPSDEWSSQQYILQALDDPGTPPEVLRWSLRMLRPDHKALSFVRIEQFIAADDPQLRLEAVRSLRESNHTQRASMLKRVARTEQYPIDLRAEAIVGLSGEFADQKELLLQLARRGPAALRDEALRSLRGAQLSAAERTMLEAMRSDARTRELIDRVLHPDVDFERPKPTDLDGWLRLVDGPNAAADAAAGERVFFHPRAAGCSRCHQMTGRGGHVGPELTTTASRLSRGCLIESIVRPGKEIAPHFAAWRLVTTSGTTLVGVLVDEQATGEQTYADSEGKLHRFAPGEIEVRQPVPTSIMPDTIARQLTVQEFRDLIAYLQLPARHLPVQVND